MCVSLAPASFSRTTLYAAEAKKDGATVHVLGYQNRVQNLYRQAIPLGDDWDWRNPQGRPIKSGTGNAMILPIPAVPGTMTHANLLDTSGCRNILRDMAAAVRPVRRGGSRGSDAVSFGAVAKNVQVFDHDIYTVVLAGDARSIPGALGRVPEGKRPALNTAIFEAYHEWYPDWTFALCCFNNDQAAEAAPLLWFYQPQRPELLFAPALDSHSGSAPKPGAMVEVDHTVVVAALGQKIGERVDFSDDVSEVAKQLLSDKVIGSPEKGRQANGDFVCRVSDVRSGKYAPRRLPPPGHNAR